MVNNNLKYTTWSDFAKAVLFLCLLLSPSALFAQSAKNRSAQADTFKIANRLIAHKKFRKAGKVLKKYHTAHPTDLNSVWLEAQARLYANDYKQSYQLYQSAIKLQPNNDYLKLDYIHSLADMGKTSIAENALHVLENNGTDYSDISLLHARLYYYNGDNEKAAAYMKKALQYDNKAIEANELNDEIELARAPKVSLTSAYLSDNQPLTMLTTGLRAEKYFNRSLDMYIEADDFHFMQNNVTDAPWVRIGDKLFFPKAGMRIDISGGVMQFPYQNTIGWTGRLNVNEKISQQFDIDLGVDHCPYFGTLASVDTTVSVTKFSAMLNWHKSNWQGQAALLNSLYQDNNNVYAAYAWILAPIVTFATGKLQAGLSTSYSNSNQVMYRSANTLNEILTNYNPNTAIAGVYNPYFTPNNMYISSVLASFSMDLSKRVAININGDVGSGSIQNPYLFLDKDKSGNVFLNRGFSTEYFTPYSATASINYHIDKTWMLSGKYTYRSTYFFTSNYVTVGIEKSFLHQNKVRNTGKGKSAFSRKVQDIEDRIQALYSAKDPADLRQTVSGIRARLVALRDEQQKEKTMTEVIPGSEKAAVLQDRYNSLNEMIAEIDAAGLGDKDNEGNKKEWMVDKQYELTAIRYNGNLDEE